MGDGLRTMFAYWAERGVAGWEGKESGEREFPRERREGLGW